MNNKMMINVTARCHDDYDTGISLDSPDLYVFSNVKENLEELVQSVINSFEDQGITIDCNGDDNTLGYDLPDTFDNVSQAYRVASKLMKKLQKIYKPYIVINPTIQIQKQNCCSNV